MKNFLIAATLFSICSLCGAQPALTLWVTPDGYHGNHNHAELEEYFCDSSYYLFYQNHEDTLFVTVKNEGDQPLDLTAAATQSIAGSSFQVVNFSPQQIIPGEMHTIKIFYQLPSEYVDGINGQLSISSNDPNRSNCTLYFDVGCGATWNTTTNDAMGVDGSCNSPVIWIADGNFLSDPNMVYDDSMVFYTYEAGFASNKVMKLDHKGGVIIPNFQIVQERLEAGSRPGNPSNFKADSFRVQIQKDLDVEGTATIDGFLDVRANAKVVGNLDVLDDLTVNGIFEVDQVITPSDRRKKKEIIDLHSASKRIMDLRPKSYFLKNEHKSNQQQFGFIAQELESVIPEVVHTADDGMKAVNYMQLIPWLTGALQEQQKTIAKLEERIDELEGR